MVKSEGGQQVFQESKQRKHLSKYVRRWIIAVCAVVIVIGGFVTWRVMSGRNERQANQARVVDYFVRNYEGIETIEFTSYNKQWVAGYAYTSERVNGAPIRIAVVLDTGEVMKPKHSDISENTMDDVKLGWLHDRRYGVKKRKYPLKGSLDLSSRYQREIDVTFQMVANTKFLPLKIMIAMVSPAWQSLQ